MGIELLYHQFWEFSGMLTDAENRRFFSFFDAIKIQNYMKGNLKMNKYVKLRFIRQKWDCRKNFEISCRILITSFNNRNATVFSPLYGAYFQKKVFKILYCGFIRDTLISPMEYFRLPQYSLLVKQSFSWLILRFLLF